MNSEIVISTKNLHKSFQSSEKIDILIDINFEARKGETIAITGKSGSGKSTLLSIIGTLESATSGSVTLCGKMTSQSNSSELRNHHIGFIFQSFHLLEDYSVLENVLMPAKIARKSISKQSESYKRALLLLEQVGLSHRINSSAKTLSGGEKQRACIARALCNSPDIILADEPTGNLDRTNAEMVSRILFENAKNTSSTLILVTHDQELSQQCDKSFHLKDGFLHLVK